MGFGKDLGNRIREIRGTKTQEEFASELGLDRRTFGSWEKGRHFPKIDILLSIARHGNVSIDWLVGNEQERSYKDEMLYSDKSWQKLVSYADKKGLSALQVRDAIKEKFSLD